MKKVVLSIMLTFALALGIAAPALAANNLPVFVEGQKIAEPALVKKGVSYLPMRAIYEALGAKVDWDAKNQRVIATEPNGTWTEIPLKGEQAEVTYHKGDDVYVTASADLTERPPFMQRGRVYLPVRTVSELLGYDVAYTKDRVMVAAPKLTYDDGKGGVYTLNLLSGELTLAQDGQSKLLGAIDLPGIDSPNSYYDLSEFKVSRTPHGNYLFETDGVGSGALSFQYKVSAWIPKAGGAFDTYLGRDWYAVMPDAFWTDGLVWLPDEFLRTVAVNDASGEVTVFDGFGMQRWCDGRFVLSDTNKLYDTKTAQMVDLQEVLITDERKADINAWVRQRVAEGSYMTEQQYLNMVWGLMGSAYTPDPHVALNFDAAKTAQANDGQLHFNFGIYGMGEGYPRWELTYTLPQ